MKIKEIDSNSLSKLEKVIADFCQEFDMKSCKIDFKLKKAYAKQNGKPLVINGSSATWNFVPNMEIVELTPELADYVKQVVMFRWDETVEGAEAEVQRWLDKKDGSICFVGLVDDKPMATGVFETYSTVDESIPCWNTLLWVEPAHRGNDYGRDLTQRRFSYAREQGFTTVYLDTISAAEYHSKFGWTTINEFDKNGEHYIIMKKDL